MFIFYFITYTKCGDNMTKDEKKLKQIELAKLFYEMGMEEEVVIKISGINPTEYLDIKKDLVDKDK